MKTLLSVFCLCACSALCAQNPPSEFKTVSRYYSDEIGTRLVVRPEARVGSFANSLELRIEDETFFDPQLSEFREREVATIQGGGLSNLGLRFFTANRQGQEEMIQVLEEFQSKIKAFRRNQQEIEKLDESWMGQGEAALSQSRKITEIQTDFLDRPSVVSLNWNLESGRLWLSLDDFINIDSPIAEPLINLIQRIPEYSRERIRLGKEIARKNEWINTALSLPENAENQPTADTIDTPTKVSEERKGATPPKPGK